MVTMGGYIIGVCYSYLESVEEKKVKKSQVVVGLLSKHSGEETDEKFRF